MEVAKVFTYVLFAVFLVVSVNAYDIDSIGCSSNDQCPIEMFCNEQINFCEYRLKNGLSCNVDSQCASRNCEGTCECKTKCHLSDRGYLEPLKIEFKLQQASAEQITISPECESNKLVIEAANGWTKSYEFNNLDNDETQHYDMRVFTNGQNKEIQLIPKTDIVYSKTSSCVEPTFWDSLTTFEKWGAILLGFILLKIVFGRRK